MATSLDRRVDALELQSAAQHPRRADSEFFADWTDDELRAELRRLELGLPRSDKALATLAEIEGAGYGKS